MPAAEPGVSPVPVPAILDAVILLVEILRVRERIDDAALTEVEAYAAGGSVLGRLVLDHAAGQPIPRVALIAAAAFQAQTWLEGGAEQLVWLPLEPVPVFTDQESPQPDLATLTCLRELARLREAEAKGVSLAEARSKAVEEFLRLCDVLTALEQWSFCARAAGVASNFAVSASERATACTIGARAAARAEMRDLMALHLAYLVAAKVQEAANCPEDAALRVRAVVAMHTALRHVRELEDYRPAALAALRGAAQELGEPLVQVLLDVAAGPPPAVDGSDTDAALTRSAAWHYTLPTWDLELEREVSQVLSRIAALTPEVENLAFVPKAKLPRETQLEARWTTATFDHPSYRQAIPHGRTLYREGEIATILFEIVHEVSHLVCLLGGVGAAMTALRAAAVQLEATLWAHVPTERHHESQQSLIAPLEDSTMLALAQAEQALEPVRCTHLLQGVWGPWLEGVAVFNELGSDPNEGDMSSLVGDVIANLVDVGIPPNLAEQEAISQLAHSRKETDALFAHVLRTWGLWRLRFYLGNHWHKYGPGYLAVRAVVASWRKTLDRPLTGTEAARVLLHVTRYGALDAIPDLGIGSHRFKRTALERMTRWVLDIARMSRDDLEYALMPGVQWGWRNGQLLRETEFEAGHVVNSADRFVDLARQAWSVHRGDRSDPARVGQLSPHLVDLISAAAQALTYATHRDDLSLTVGYHLDAQARSLPIGTVQAPFWLNRRTGRFSVAVRTTDVDKDHGRPGYDLVGLSLTPEEFDSLRQEMRLRPDERMRVTRLADLTPAEFGGDRIAGRNVVAYSFGDWLHVRNAGLYWSLPQVPEDLFDEVKERLSPQPGHVLEIEVCEGRKAAARTVEWIDRATAWHEDGEALPIAAWVQRVRDLAIRVRDRDDDVDLERLAGAELLTAIWGKSAHELTSDGLDAITYGEAPRLSKLTESLLMSARGSAPSSWLDSVPPDDEMHMVFTKGRAWDVRPVIEED